MYLDEGMQDLTLLPKNRRFKPLGTSNNGVQDSNPEVGHKVVEAIVAEVRQRVTVLLRDYAEYQGHGSPF